MRDFARFFYVAGKRRKVKRPLCVVASLFEEVLGEFVEGFAPDLPFVVAGVGVEFYIYTTALHFLYDVAGVVYAGILLTAA